MNVFPKDWAKIQALPSSHVVIGRIIHTWVWRQMSCWTDGLRKVTGDRFSPQKGFWCLYSTNDKIIQKYFEHDNVTYWLWLQFSACYQVFHCFSLATMDSKLAIITAITCSILMGGCLQLSQRAENIFFMSNCTGDISSLSHWQVTSPNQLANCLISLPEEQEKWVTCEWTLPIENACSLSLPRYFFFFKP